jgi:uncharacterized protein (TIGR00369 family)
METALTQQRIDFLAKDYCRGFIKYCGLQALEIKKGLFISRVLIGDNHRTQDNFIHAGLMATMADHTAGYSAFTMVSENYRILTIEFKINFLKPAYGNALQCRAKVINRGKQIIVSESKIFDVRDKSQKLVAKAIVTMMAVPAESIANTKS